MRKFKATIILTTEDKTFDGFPMDCKIVHKEIETLLRDMCDEITKIDIDVQGSGFKEAYDEI